MKLLIYWLYAAIVSGIWFFWRYRIYENEFLIIDDALKDCVNWGKRNGYLLPEKPSYFQFFLVERPWNILILNFTFLPLFLINLVVILLLISPWERKVMRYKRAMKNLKDKFFDDLDLRYPDIQLDVKSDTLHGQISNIINQTGDIFTNS